MKTKNILKISVILTMCIFITFNSLAAESSKKPEDIIKSCIDDQTFAVIHVNIEKLSISAFVEKVKDIFEKQAGSDSSNRSIAMFDDLNNFDEQVNAHINDLKKLGTKDCFVIFSMYDFPYFFVAFQAGSDQAGLTKKILDIMEDFDIGTLDMYSNDGLIIAGLEQTIARIKTIKPVKSDILSRGLEACGDTTFQTILFPSSDQRKIMAEMLPQISFGTERIDFTELMRDFEWAALGLDSPPSMSMNVTIQSQNSEKADKILSIIKNLYSFAEQNPNTQEFREQISQVLKLMTPQKRDSQILLNVDSKIFDSIINEYIAPSILKTQDKAYRLVCATNLSGIGKAILIYANDNDDNLPPNLEILTSTVEMPPKGLICPSTGQKDSYIYRGAGLTTSDEPGMVLAYDKKGNHEGGRNVLFLDSHVDWVTEERFQEYIRKDNESRKKTNRPEISAD
ncbi:MAG: hypothetical protein JXA96_05510 [Sedimentisphaerales bacterium]|nr:hypothetical protein [Sedimentisphaerales bacterium]